MVHTHHDMTCILDPGCGDDAFDGKDWMSDHHSSSTPERDSPTSRA